MSISYIQGWTLPQKWLQISLFTLYIYISRTKDKFSHVKTFDMRFFDILHWQILVWDFTYDEFWYRTYLKNVKTLISKPLKEEEKNPQLLGMFA